MGYKRNYPSHQPDATPKHEISEKIIVNIVNLLFVYGLSLSKYKKKEHDKKVTLILELLPRQVDNEIVKD